MQSVIHHDRSTNYETVDRGAEGDPILFVHGSGGTHDVWKSQFSRLSDTWPIVGVDLSGHGGSQDISTPPGPETMESYVEDTLAVADATGASVLVGNSLGGAIAMTAVVERTPDLDALVLVGSGAKLAVREDLRGWLENDFERAIEFLHGEDMLLHDPDPRLVELSQAGMREVGRAVTHRDYLTSHQFDLRDRIDEISVPTLAVTGEYDQLTPPMYHEYLAENIPDAEWTTLPDSAHLSMLEAPEHFNETLSAFLESL